MEFHPLPRSDTGRDTWNIKCGKRAAGIRNPIREIMDTIAGKENPQKRIISMAQGDPSAYPHLRPPQTQVDAVIRSVASATANGYQPSQGNGACREAIAKYFNVPGRSELRAQDVFMTIGCSEALSHCVAALAFDGANMLVPKPGFPLYEVLCDYHGVEVRYYDLLPDQDWECDIESMKKLIDKNTCSVLVNNPSNPCGAVYSKKHLIDVMNFAEQEHVLVIADEVYHGMSFEPGSFVACADVNPRVPVISVCALSKVWVTPGWRVGWISCYDSNGIMAGAGVQDTFLKLCQVSLGPTAPIQAAIPSILQDTPREWYDTVLKALEISSKCCVRRVAECPGLEVASNPQGAMYVMVRIVPGALEGLDDDVEFAGALLQEESVVVLPGQCFQYPGFFRVVFAAPVAALEEGWDRIESFCSRHIAKA